MKSILANCSENIWSRLIALIPVFLILLCSTKVQVTGTVDTTDTGIVAMLYNPNGTPAIGANVKIFKSMDSSKVPVKLIITDQNGRYSLKGLSKGAYNVYAQKDSLVAFQDSVAVLDDTILVKNDTLEKSKSITAVVGLQPNHDPRTVTVQVLGTDIYSNVNESGNFTLNKLGSGNYTLKLSSTLPNYTNTFKQISINTNTPDSLTDTLWLIYTGIPVVENLTATYDTLIGVVKLNWKATKYRGFQDYIIYRDNFDSLHLSSLPINFTEDTVFYDTIFDKKAQNGAFSFNDSNDYHFKYRVTVRNNSQQEGLSYKYIGIMAASPQKVKTVIVHQSYHIEKGLITDTASENDSIQFLINLSNPTRKLREIKYTELENGSIIRLVAINSLQQFKDTLYHKWGTIGQKQIEISAIDLAGTIWKDTINFNIIADLPQVLFANTLVYLNVPFSLKGVDRFGSIESLSIDTSHYVQYQKMSDTIIQVIIRDTLADKFVLNCTIVDDDGNKVKNSFTFSTGLKWEKIADNFLDTNTIRSVVELDNTLFAFTTSSHANQMENYKLKFSLYSSTDAIHWSKIKDSLPWSNWFTKPIVHNGQILLIEGISDSTDTNRIWYSSNGVEWQSEQLVNFPKWFSRPKYTYDSYVDFQDIMFVSFDGKLWAGSKDFYGYNTEDILLNSENGITWNTVTNGETPPANSYSSSDPTVHIVANNELWYIEGYMSSCLIWKTNNFISHTSIGRFSMSGSGAIRSPIPVLYLNKVFLCSSKSTMYGEFMTFIDNGQISQSKYEYPGSLVHCCVVFNNRLYSISNNGVYTIK